MQQVFSKSDVIVWECRNCGHIVIGTQAPEVCMPIPRAIFNRTRRVSPPPCLSVQSLYSPSICKFPVNHFHVKSCKFVLQSVQSSNFDTIPKISPKPCFSALLFGLPFLLDFLQRIFHRTNIHYPTLFLKIYVDLYHFCIKNNSIRHL